MKNLNKATLTIIAALALSPITYANESAKQKCASVEHCCARSKMDNHHLHRSKKQKTTTKSDWRSNRPIAGDLRSI